MKEWICEEVPALTMDGKVVSTMLHQEQELVRCKDCKDACIFSDDWVICTHIDSNGNDKHSADWFCADGERK